MKLALVVLLMAFGLTSCFQDKGSESNESDRSSADSKEDSGPSKKSEYKRIRDEIAGLKKVKGDLEDKIKAIEEGQKNSSTLAEKEIAVAANLEQVRGYRNALDAHEAALDESLSQWKAATRGSFKGVKLPGIETIKGAKYSGVTITRIDDESITFEHSGGMETIPVLDLPLSLRKNVIHEATVISGSVSK